jgi:integrase
MHKSFQAGELFKRGTRRKVWVARWYERQKMQDGSIKRARRSEVLGLAADVSKAQAWHLLSVKIDALNRGAVQPRSVMTFQGLAEEWRRMVLDTYRPTTRKFYASTLDRYVLPYWSKWFLSDIKLLDVKSWLASKGQAYSTSVVKHMRATLSKMLADAVEMGHLTANPAKGFRTPRGKAVKRACVLSQEQIGKVLARLEEPHRTAVRLVSVLGLRESELAGLRFCDLDFLNKTVTVRQSRYQGQVSQAKTEGSARILPMPTGLEALLRGLAETCPNSERLLFCDGAGKPFNFDNVSRDMFGPLAKSLGIPHFTWRSFRRGVSTQMHRNGVPLKALQDLLGHSNPQMTLVYTQTALEDLRKAVDGLELELDSNRPQIATYLQ